MLTHEASGAGQIGVSQQRDLVGSIGQRVPKFRAVNLHETPSHAVVEPVPMPPKDLPTRPDVHDVDVDPPLLHAVAIEVGVPATVHQAISLAVGEPGANAPMRITILTDQVHHLVDPPSVMRTAPMHLSRPSWPDHELYVLDERGANSQPQLTPVELPNLRRSDPR